MTGRGPARLVAPVAAILAIALIAACSEKKDNRTASTTTRGGSTETTAPCEATTIVECAPEGSTLAALFPEEPTKASGEPVKIGTINQESGVGGAFPELTLADQAAVEFVNEELGGVDGRPLELIVCDTKFSPAGSQQCAQQMVQEEVVAVVGGLDLFGDGIDILEQNGIPFVGGIPVSFPSVRNPISFQFSGGSWGAFLAFADYSITKLKAKRVAIMYGEFGSIADAAQYGQRALEAAGVDVTMIPFPIVTTDYLTPLTAANESDPDAIFVGTADTGCVPTLQGAAEMGIEAELFWVGACVAPKIVEAAGVAIVQGRLFNTEGPPISGDDPDVVIYKRVLEKYGDGLAPASAATIAFRSFMNLYVQLRAIDIEALTAQAVIDRFRGAVDVPSFMGHPYTCDREQMPGLPSMCAPQEKIGEYHDGWLRPLTGWIDVSARAG